MKEVSYFYDGVIYNETPTLQTGKCRGCIFDNGHCLRPEDFPEGCSERDTIWIKVEKEQPAEETKPESKATDIQEGGSNYKEMKFQPIEYIHGNNLNFFEGNVVKYVTRHKSKNGAEDIKKAIHYLNLILQFEYGQ